MDQVRYRNRCKCNETSLIVKKQNFFSISEGKPFKYPQLENVSSKTICIKYPYRLSLEIRFILNSFQNKYIFYAIDDITSNLNLALAERETLLSILHSPILYLQNHFLINSFDIWLHNIYIKENLIINKFINPKSKKVSNSISYITIQFFYKTRSKLSKQESLW